MSLAIYPRHSAASSSRARVREQRRADDEQRNRHLPSAACAFSGAAVAAQAAGKLLTSGKRLSHKNDALAIVAINE